MATAPMPSTVMNSSGSHVRHRYAVRAHVRQRAAEQVAEVAEGGRGGDERQQLAAAGEQPGQREQQGDQHAERLGPQRRAQAAGQRGRAGHHGDRDDRLDQPGPAVEDAPTAGAAASSVRRRGDRSRCSGCAIMRAALPVHRIPPATVSASAARQAKPCEPRRGLRPQRRQLAAVLDADHPPAALQQGQRGGAVVPCPPRPGPAAAG